MQWGPLCWDHHLILGNTPQAAADKGEEKGFEGGTSGDVREEDLS